MRNNKRSFQDEHESQAGSLGAPHSPTGDIAGRRVRARSEPHALTVHSYDLDTKRGRTLTCHYRAGPDNRRIPLAGDPVRVAAVRRLALLTLDSSGGRVTPR